MNSIELILISVSAVLLGAALTVAARKVALRVGLVAIPRTDRWHKKPVALLGGAAIYAAFVLSFLVFGPDLPRAYVLVAAGTLMFVTGLFDDARHIRPYTKLVIQFIAAAVLVYFGFHLPWVDYAWVNDVLTIFWLVGITNAINLLDNMDGLAGGVSVIACAFLAVTLLLNGQAAEAVLPIMLGSTVLGFLFFNFQPASIFMGDSGSMFLGFMLSGMALLSDTGRFSNLTSVLLTPVLILMIPIFDTCIVTFTRKLSGRPISQGGRDHTSHRLVALGVTERRAVVSLYVFAGVSGLLALSLRWVETAVVIALVPSFALLVLVLGLYLGKVRVYEDGEQFRGVAIVNAVADFKYKRRILEVLIDVALIALAYYGAYLLRWDGQPPGGQLEIFLRTLPILIIIEILSLLVGGVYKGLWRYVGVDDLVIILRSVLAGAALSCAAVFLLYEFQGPSATVFLLNLLLLVVLVSASRLSFRLARAVLLDRTANHPDAKPVLIYGAGDGSELLIREILTNPSHQFAPVGFIDDDERKAGKVFHGYRIFASHELPELIRAYKISDVIVPNLNVAGGKLDMLRGLGLCLRRMSVRIE